MKMATFSSSFQLCPYPAHYIRFHPQENYLERAVMST